MSIFRNKEYRLYKEEDDDDYKVTFITDDDPNGVVLFSGEKFYGDECVSARIIDGIWYQIDISGNWCLHEINNPAILEDIKIEYTKTSTGTERIRLLAYLVADFILNSSEFAGGNLSECNEEGTIDIFEYNDIKIKYHKTTGEYKCVLELAQDGAETTYLKCYDCAYIEGMADIKDAEYILDLMIQAIA